MAKTKAKRRAASATRSRKAAKPARSGRARPASRKAAAKKGRARPAAKKARPAPRKAAPRRASAPGKKAAPRPSAKKVAKQPKKVVPQPKKVAARAGSAKVARRPLKAAAKVSTSPRLGRAPTLDRPRRRVGEVEMVPSPPSSLDMDRSASAARTGRAEMNEKLHEHTSSSPALTAGDVDADWEGAEATGDEAPGGDNMTPDQDVVEEIGQALGVVYDDDEELRGGEEIGERDKKRWELDPASSEDFDDRDEK